MIEAEAETAGAGPEGGGSGEAAAAARGETALGVRTPSTGQVELNPSKQATWDQPADRELVTLVTTSR